jgi:DNA polymerase I-like protein with 3'-5' exonuclease and polymerase domains
VSKYCYIDFEYFGTTNPKLNLVCCSLSFQGKTYDYWLHNDQEQKDALKEQLLQLNDRGFTFVAYNVVAEGRSFSALGIDPSEVKWIDLYLEYRMLTNHNHKLQYGKQLIEGRKIKTVPPKPKYAQTEQDKKGASSAKPHHNLAAACYKLLGILIDTNHKNDMRDLIISAPDKFTREEQTAIMKYCRSDIKYLPKLLSAMLKEFDRLLPRKMLNTLYSEMLLRGDYAARTAIMEDVGYPVNVEWVRNWSTAIPYILKECQEDINRQFPDLNIFKWNKNSFKYSWNQKSTKEWIKEQGLDKGWMRTDSNDLSLSLDAWTKVFPFAHNYPEGNLGAQIVRYLKLKQSLNGFSTGNNKKSFFDSLGPDGRVRCFMNIYGSQSSRSQPPSTSFMFLKPAFQRALVVPSEGRYIGAYDYGSEEFLISALWSMDENMIAAYESGDVYLYFAKLAEAVPWEGKREDHEDIRDKFKATTLGISYLMSKYGLAKKLTNDTGVETSEDEAQELIDKFDDAFYDFKNAREGEIEAYQDTGHTKLPCGWYMFGDNDNDRSVANCPIQGFGAAIMRKAVEFAQEAGLDVIFTLHDAVYIEGDIGNEKEDMDVLADCMDRAFKYYFRDTPVADRANVRLDGYVWSPEFEVGGITTEGGNKLGVYNIYIDPRAKSEYKKFSKYFLNNVLEDVELL